MDFINKKPVEKTNIAKALVFCVLICLAGGALFGLIYYFGYYMFWLSVLEVIWGYSMYCKFVAEKDLKIHLPIAIILTTVLTFAFNFLAMLICETLLISQEFGLNFSSSWQWLMELWNTEAEIQSYMNNRLGQIGGMSLAGCFVVAIIMIVSIISRKNEIKKTKQIQNENKEIVIEAAPKKVNVIYFNLFTSCKSVVEAYIKDKNSEMFKEKMHKLKVSYANDLKDEAIKTELKSTIENNLKKEDLPKLDKLTLETLTKIIK